MAKDIRRAKRVAHLLGTMEQVARKTLGDANRTVTDLQTEQRKLLESLSADHDLSGVFIDLLAKRSHAISRLLDQKIGEQMDAAVAWRQARLKSNAAKEAVAEAEKVNDALRAAKDMEQLLEDGKTLGRARSR